MLQNAGVLYILSWKCASRHSGVPFLQIETSKMAPSIVVFCTFWLEKCASRHSGVPFLQIVTSSMGCFVHFDLQMCFAPQRRAIFPDRDLQNGSGNEAFCTFWLRNVLRATAASHFSRSRLAKWLRSCGVLYILTYKCASRHSGVPFFPIETCKMAPNLRCFVHFDLQMCFAPQRRAIFHSSSQQLPPHPPL